MSEAITHKNISGFSLVELSIVILIAGLVMGGAILGVKPIMHKTQYGMTQKKMDKISHALASYVLRHNRLPCPAAPNPGTEPLGSERDSGANGTDYGTCTGTDVSGIVPYRTLGLHMEDAFDAWGRYITYRVSPVFAANTNTLSDSDLNDVHERCRSSKWIDGGDNLNPSKARFCCPMAHLSDYEPTDDLQIFDGIGGDLLVHVGRSDTASRYDDVDTLETGTVEMDAVAIAYVLVSHGVNGHGAFLVNGTDDVYTVSATVGQGFGADEQTNMGNDADQIIVYRDIDRTTDITFFDDIVFWRTQDEVYSEISKDTCNEPW